LKKSQQRMNSARAMGGIKKRHNMNYSTAGDTFLTVLTVPHRKAGGNRDGRISPREPSPSTKREPTETSKKRVACNGVELIAQG
jgi:hypothetical protein